MLRFRSLSAISDEEEPNREEAQQADAGYHANNHAGDFSSGQTHAIRAAVEDRTRDGNSCRVRTVTGCDRHSNDRCQCERRKPCLPSLTQFSAGNRSGAKDEGGSDARRSKWTGRRPRRRRNDYGCNDRGSCHCLNSMVNKSM